MRELWFALTGIGLMLGLSVQQSMASTRLEGRIIDDQTKELLAARVAITNSNGTFLEIEGEHPHVSYLNKRWCYVNGTFSLTVPDAGAGLEIRRGFETRPFSLTIAGNSTEKTLQRTFPLHRWIDMRKKGYICGDLHAHLPIPKEAHSQMQAEDLNALNLLYLPSVQNPIPINNCFTGRLDANSTPGCEIYVGHEIQEWQMGHITLLNLTNLVAGYPDFGGSMEYWQTKPHWDLVRAMRAARAQNGTVFWSHFCSLPGAQSPVAIALGLIDGIELLTWNDPGQFPNHWGPWLNSGMSQAEFPAMRALDLYYLYLNAGFVLPIAAGTDKMFEEIPLGSNRVYAQVKEPANYAMWLEAVKAGKGFVSNGPLLEFEAGSHKAGERVEFHGNQKVKARVKAQSILPFNTLEIVCNGQSVSHKTVHTQNLTPVDGIYTMEVETSLDLSKSSWVAARVMDHPDIRNRILPRDVPVFAHTNPIYFLQDGKRIRDEASIAYLRKYVEGVLHWLGTKPKFTNKADYESAVSSAQEALKIYQNL